MSKKDIKEANELIRIQEKIFTPTFNELMTDIVHDLNERDAFNEELVKKMSAMLHKRSVGECVVALTYLLSLVASEKRFMKAIQTIENAQMRETQNYIG